MNPSPESQEAINSFLQEEYTPTKIEARVALAHAVKQLCSQRLTSRGILACCKCRVKSEDSMRAKLQKLWVRGDWQTIEDIRNLEYLDFVGVRICLYFLSQIDEVERIFQEEPGLRLLQIMNFGRFGVEEKHRSIRPCLERSGAYEAKHFWVEVAAVEADTVRGQKVEIQVRSAFMEAWAEMQHDLAYKEVLRSSNDEECRILNDIRETTRSCERMAERLRVVRERKASMSTVERAKI